MLAATVTATKPNEPRSNGPAGAPSPHTETTSDGHTPVRRVYGSEGLGFESLQARNT
jgi:hypothetical protein